MWIVKLALRRPYTFVVMAVLIAVLGGLSILTMQKDIFPFIDLPVVSIIWSYRGISPYDMANRLSIISQRALTTSVNDIEHMEANSFNGLSVIRLFFQPNVKIDLAITQVVSSVGAIIPALPPNTFIPNVVKYDASTVPILQLGISSKNLSEQQLYDLSQNVIRTQLVGIAGAAVPLPYGGKLRQIMVDIDPAQLYARNLSATDISAAVNAQNLILPAGTAKIGNRDYFINLNSSPSTIEAMNDLPIKTVNGATIYVKDVAQVRDGNSVQTSIVRQNGQRSVLLTILKNGQASTLDIVENVKAALPAILPGLPPGITVKPLFDQSIFVRAAISGVVREAAIAAVFTALMILLFLGSWRSTVIVCTSIPLSILTSCLMLWAMGYTLNVMTLGGLALAVGILVDDATVEIENVHRNMGMAKPLTRAILDGAQQIALPAFVSTLAICIVFVPVLLLTGPARFLFTPLALAVAFAMLMSYFLTRTLVPTMVHFMLRPEVDIYAHGEEGLARAKGVIWQTHHAFNRVFERMRTRYRNGLSWCLHHRGRVTFFYAAFVGGSLFLLPMIGTDFFPNVDAGQMRLHVRAPEGTRLEETERIFAQAEQIIRAQLQPGELDQILDNIGLPTIPFNMIFGDSNTLGPADGDILISLQAEHHRPTELVQRQIRKALRATMPDETFFFPPANMTNQILNFGVPAPIDVQVVGNNANDNFRIAKELVRKISAVPGAVDVHVNQEMNTPSINFDVDRSKASQSGLTQRDVANSMLISLSSSSQGAPTSWVSPINGVSYTIAVQTPQRSLDSIDAIRRTPITSPGGGNTQLLDNLLSNVQRGVTSSLISHYNVQPVFDVLVNTDQRDLGGVASDIQKIVDDTRAKSPKTTRFAIRGQVDTMQTSFRRLGYGMLFAILLVYLLMVVNFQSWLDPFIILTALPGAFAGILWALFATQTTFNVPSLMGAIMAVGVATANSILLVTFANDERAEGKDQFEAALSGGYTRIRPVLMTALAMIIGMLPMAFGIGEGAEQNAPLARAVIGGLVMATVSTLFFVPVIYSFLRKRAPVDQDRRIEEEEHEMLPA